MTNKVDEHRELAKGLYDLLVRGKEAEYEALCRQLAELEKTFKKEDWLDMIQRAGIVQAKIAYAKKMEKCED